MDVNLLLETGDSLLTETGAKILLENVQTDQILPFKVIIMTAQNQMTY